MSPSINGNSRFKQTLKRLAYTALRGLEALAFGPKCLESPLVKLLDCHYKSRFRRDWKWTLRLPHYFYQRIAFFNFGFRDSQGPFSFYRGFYGSEIIRDGDVVLDLSCGDGFFTRKFFSPRASHIDGIDINSAAIATARKFHSAENVSYHLVDAVTEKFPRKEYDVIIWDAAIKYFPAESVKPMIEKVASALKQGGVFQGSAPLGVEEGHEHYSVFPNMKALDELFATHFKFRSFRLVEYKIATSQNSTRLEAYWRCSNDASGLLSAAWQSNVSGS